MGVLLSGPRKSLQKSHLIPPPPHFIQSVACLQWLLLLQVFHRTEQPVIPDTSRCLNVPGPPAHIRTYEEHGPGSTGRQSFPHGTRWNIWNWCDAHGGQSLLPKMRQYCMDSGTDLRVLNRIMPKINGKHFNGAFPNMKLLYYCADTVGL